ncbi:MAG TPA: metalloprotease TldD [Burkholderiaceae bacterium]|nr:metalloprotease TldD [Burkholderiaceae bacterium]
MKIIHPVSSAFTASSALGAAKTTLLEPWGLSENHLSGALATIASRQIDYADLYFQFSRNENWSLDEGIVKAGSYGISQGVGVRAISGEKTAFAYSDALTSEAIQSCAQTVRSIAHQGNQQKPIQLASSTQAASLYTPNDPVSSLGAADKVALLERLDQLARAADPRIVQVMAGLGADYDVVLIATSDGRLSADIRPLVRLSITVIAEKNGRREVGNSGGGGRVDLAYFTDELLQHYVNEAVHSALINLEAAPAPAGEMTVVLGAGWPGILLHEAVGHGLEGDFNRKGTSVFSNRIGERVAAPGVTVVDDGTISNRRGSLNIDDEGNPTQRNVLIEDGVLKGYMQDHLNAGLMGVPVTGNGRRESFAHVPMPRMTNTYMLAGQHSPEEIIASVKNGLYAANFGGGQVDITSGKFVFSASEAYRIENGKLTQPVKGATLIGNGADALNRIQLIGNNLELDSGVGTCGKDGQSVPVGVGMPTVRIDGLTVGGTA